MKKQICIIHNLSEENLLYARELGGIVNPSLAISSNENILSGYGEITLIKNPNTFKMSDHLVFNADVYSPRMPRITYSLNEDLFSEINKEVEDACKYFDIQSSEIEMIFNKDRDNEDLVEGRQKARLNLENSISMMLLFSMEKELDVSIERVDIPLPFDFLTLEKLKEIKIQINNMSSLEDIDNYLSETMNSELLSSIEQELKKDETLSPDIYDEELEYLYSERYRVLFKKNNEKNHELNFIALNKIKKFLTSNDLSKKKVDQKSLKKHLQKNLSSNGKIKSEYSKWLDCKIENGFNDPYFEVKINNSWNTRKMEATPENISRQMKKETRSNESSAFKNVVGNIRASICHQFKRKKEIEENIDMLISKDLFENIARLKNDEFQYLSEYLNNYFKFSATGMLYTDAVADVLIQYAKTGSFDKVSESFNTIENKDEIKEKIDEFMLSMVKMPSPYFEAKSKKVYQIDDFEAALVPENASDEVVKYLKENNILITRYDENKELSRTSALNNHSNLFFGNGGEIQFNMEKNESTELSI